MSQTSSLAVLAATPGAERATGRQAWAQLRSSSPGLARLVLAWVIATAVAPTLVVVALGVVIARVPAAIVHGMGSPAGHRLIAALAVAALVYGLSLMLDPIGTALGTAAKARITGALQGRLLRAVSAPVGVSHLEDADVLDRLARAEGSLTGFFPGDAPVTWAGILASRIGGAIGCVVVALYSWWLGALLLVTWLVVRRFVLAGVVRQATELRAETTVMRRAWYLIGVGSKVRDAKEVRVFGLASFIADRFRDEYRASIAVGSGGLRDLHRRAAIGFAAVVTVYAIGLASIAHDARTGAIDLRSLAILLPMLAVTSSAGSISFDDVTLAWALAGIPDADRLEHELTPDEVTGPGTIDASGLPRSAIVCRSLAFRYPGATTDVLEGLELDLPAGTSTAIVGVNGAGKSTLVSLLVRLRDPTGGAIEVDGHDLRELDAARWQRNVAIMPQDPARYPVSVYENVVFGSLEHRDDREGVEAVARTSGLADVVARLPHGWDTVLSSELPGGVDLSGGQWQRLALARALFATRHGARLLILDEPTSALDGRSEARFYERFFEITRGLTTVVISHRFATVRQADTICVLDGGRITERGSHAELVALGGAYAEMYGTQARRFGTGS
jgi:ATP-binding cassette, subfamily B, bacterial